jgi:hypothetical protein
VPVRPHVLPLVRAEHVEVDFRVIRSHTWYDIFMAKQKEKELPEGDSRVTIRVAPEYRAHLQRAALEMGVNQSILVRNAIQEYIEREKEKLSPELFARFEHFRQHRERPGML